MNYEIHFYNYSQYLIFNFIGLFTLDKVYSNAVIIFV